MNWIDRVRLTASLPHCPGHNLLFVCGWDRGIFIAAEILRPLAGKQKHVCGLGRGGQRVRCRPERTRINGMWRLKGIWASEIAGSSTKWTFRSPNSPRNRSDLCSSRRMQLINVGVAKIATKITSFSLSVHILSRTVQSICTTGTVGGTFDYDQTWICAL